MSRPSAALLVGLVWAASTAGQSPQPATVWELPEQVRAELAQVRDLDFAFDQPGFYGVVEFVRTCPHSPGFAQTPVVVSDWRELLERPNSFRGRPVTIAGVVGRNKAPYTLPERPELGLLWQLELLRTDQPLTCTLILTGSAADIPLGAMLTVTGYFVMIRQYYDAAKRPRQAALLVAPGPSAIAGPAPAVRPTGAPDWRWMAGAVTAGLVVTLVLLRRSAKGARRDMHGLHASREAPMSLADDLARWARDQASDDR